MIDVQQRAQRLVQKVILAIGSNARFCAPQHSLACTIRPQAPDNQHLPRVTTAPHTTSLLFFICLWPIDFSVRSSFLKPECANVCDCGGSPLVLQVVPVCRRSRPVENHPNSETERCCRHARRRIPKWEVPADAARGGTAPDSSRYDVLDLSCFRLSCSCRRFNQPWPVEAWHFC